MHDVERYPPGARATDPGALAAHMRSASRPGTPGPRPARRAHLLARVAARWNDPSDPSYAKVRRRLVEGDGVSAPMADLAFQWLAEDATEETLQRLAWSLHRPPSDVPDIEYRAVPPRLALVSLARSVPTAPFRALAEPLLLGVPTLVRIPSGGAALAALLAEAWNALDETGADALCVTWWDREEETCWQRVLQHVDVVSAYGGSAALRAIRARLPKGVRWIPHGHGLSASVVVLEDGTDVDPLEAARWVALDVAAFDQLGCLSPQTVLVLSAHASSARDFARLLFEEGLAPLAARLPRAPLSIEAGAAQLAWRAAAVSQGELWEGDGFAVSFEGAAAPRVTPGYRNVQVLHVPIELGAPGLARRLQAWAPHLKCIGLAGSRPWARRSCEAFASIGSAVSVVPAGRMQRPALDGPMDGRHPAERWMRWGAFPTS